MWILQDKQLAEDYKTILINTCFVWSYEVMLLYESQSFANSRNSPQPNTYCFVDLGARSIFKYNGNQCNVMGEILLSCYDHFISNNMLTDASTNLSASEQLLWKPCLLSYAGNV